MRNHIPANNIDDIIDSLNEHAYLLKKGNGMFQLQTSDYSQYR